MKAKIYTKTGDKGQTSLVGGTRVAKTNPRLEAYGTLDELNSSLGVVRSQLAEVAELKEFARSVEKSLQTIQNCLFNIGSHMACENDSVRPNLPKLKSENIAALEAEMDLWEDELPTLRNFILPGGSPAAAYCHVARTVCRRAEREIVRLADASVSIDTDHLIYVNRLSDWLFLLARRINFALKREDIQWNQD